MVWLRRRIGLLLFLHNVMQIFVAADRRYRPLYNRAVGTQIATQLQLAGYRPGSGIPVVLLSVGGGGSVDGRGRNRPPVEPATHVGPRSYISPSTLLPDGRSHLDRTTDTVLAIVRADRGATAVDPPV
ncbi:DNA-damage-inducible protein J OS=Streptomyces tendae OX=1932 GN=F3L20_20695 PE=4 SV=1 [Streptomyces tendae]